MPNRIPTVDLSKPDAEAAATIDRACRDIGFYRLIGHGVEPVLTQNAFRAARKFFEQGVEAKERQHIRHSFPHQRGYVPLYEENLDGGLTQDLKESFDLGVDLAPDDPDVLAGKPFSAPNVWPAGDAAFKAAISEYHRAMLDLGQRLVELTALGLGLPRDTFDEAMRKPVGNLRLLHYPQSPADIADDVGGCGAHTDYGFLTVLAQDGVGGLEVEAPNGEWIAVPSDPGAFVVNLGELLTRWTNGLYEARMHRVRRVAADRYSIPFFLDPNVDAMVSVLPNCVFPDRPAAYPAIAAGAYLTGRFNETFSYRK